MASTSRQPETETVNAFAGLAPPASASTSAKSPSTLQKLPCNVFINHRGPDLKHQLATDIYNTLTNMGLNVFLDSQNLHLGDFFPTELQDAMSRASLHVAIFSPTYAQSPWCLAELSFMLNTGTPIIPIFYRVQPNDLRHLIHGKGIYAASFLEHEKKGRYSIDKLREWKKALHDVSFYTGERVDTYEDERRVLKNIVNHVLKVIQMVPLEVATHPVGLEEVVADFEMTISKSVKAHHDVQIVGIWGMGGSGKTTLAKELYNLKYSSITRSSFLFDIRSAANKNELHKMQIQLLKDLECKFNDQTLNNIEQGKKILSNYLRSLPVFIIMDDVDHRDQLEALLPGKASLASGSLIIVTTRDKEVLRVWGVSCIYEMKSMNQSHAKQLFCWHAFLQPSPLLGFEDLVEKFINASNGLPLSLKVFGGQLFGCSNKDLWEDLLNKISRILPTDIINMLRVSYDALDKEEQQMFLDIACFFIGENKMTAIAVWEGSGWSGQWGWERLVNKCFVELVHEDEIRMHDHLRDLGREIASTLSPYRLWSPNQLTVINKQEEIRGITLAANDFHKIPDSLLTTSMCRDGLKVFVMGLNYWFRSTISSLSREMVWFRCFGISSRYLPSIMPLKNLRVLELDGCHVASLWEDSMNTPVQLRVLIVYQCRELQRIPKSIGEIKNLKKICMTWCNVSSLPEEFCRLQSLEHLQLQYFEKLSSLPCCFGHLTDLRHLDLGYCVALRKLPDSCKQLRFLQHLDLGGCQKLTLQLDILENMTKLKYLNLSFCRQVENLPPHHITNQASLGELYLNQTSLRKLPVNIGQLSKLRVLELGPFPGCFRMQSLPNSMGNLTLLEKLVLRDLEVQSLPESLKQLINLQTLKIYDCPIGELDVWQGPSTCLWINLKEIHLERTRVSNISISDDCSPSLKKLELLYNDYLTEVNTLPTAVEYIEVFDCKFLRNVNGIGGVVNLRELRLWNCTQLETLPSFDELTSLKEFSLRGGNKVEAMHGLHHCTSLEVLEIDGKCWEVSSIQSWEHVQRLRRLKVIAKKRSVMERCIQTIQKWPERTIICAKAVAGARSLLNPSTFHNLSVVHSLDNEEFNLSKIIYFNVFSYPMMLCFVINCRSPSMRLYIDVEGSKKFFGEVDEGKWTLIVVFTQNFTFLESLEFRISNNLGGQDITEVEKGIVVTGTEESVVEGFHRLFALLAS